MKNPWRKRNPFMSMWLSGANTVAGAARGQAAAAIKREAGRASDATAAEVTRHALKFWDAAGFAVPKAKRRR